MLSKLVEPTTKWMNENAEWMNDFLSPKLLSFLPFQSILTSLASIYGQSLRNRYNMLAIPPSPESPYQISISRFWVKAFKTYAFLNYHDDDNDDYDDNDDDMFQKRQNSVSSSLVCKYELLSNLIVSEIGPGNFRLFSANCLKRSEIGSSFHMTISDNIKSNWFVFFFRRAKNMQTEVEQTPNPT